MRIDVLSIFPEYLAPLRLSLIGRAAEAGPLDLHVHDLRDWTNDPHRTVDDTPAGGGAGMVMKPDVWGRAIDDVLAQVGDIPTPTESLTRPEGAERPERARRTVLAIPTPSGAPLTQRVVEDLATADHLVIACGRYEGIDARVALHYDLAGVETLEYSLGDYVLNGGEVAALALVEAVGRLIPGVVGNPASLDEESHGSAGLLEYPVFTRPTEWRGWQIPDVLLSGHHARIERWRRDRALERTGRNRPSMIRNLRPDQIQPGDKAVLGPMGWAVTPDGTRPVYVLEARPEHAEALAALAAATFPLACPPTLNREAIDEFIAENLSAERFAEYIAHPERHRILVAFFDPDAGDPVGYALTHLPTRAAEPPYAEDVAALVTDLPAAELSKIYVREDLHSSGIAHRLLGAMIATLGADRIDGQPIRSLWLGTNARNKRAQKFYRATGFVKVGTRRFVVGGREQHDSVWVRNLVEENSPAVAD